MIPNFLISCCNCEADLIEGQAYVTGTPRLSALCQDCQKDFDILLYPTKAYQKREKAFKNIIRQLN